LGRGSFAFAAGLRLLIACAALTAANAAAQNWTPDELEELRTRYALLDLDNDDQVTFDDMTEETLRQFNQIDVNNDDLIAIGEFLGYRGPGADRYLTRRQIELRRYTFYKKDFDLDRRLSREEYVFEARKNFNNLDADRDNVVTFAEFSRLPKARATNAARLERK